MKHLGRLLFWVGLAIVGSLAMPRGRADAPEGRYATAPDVITDTQTELMWQATPDPPLHTFEQAATHCAELALAGHDDWRVPSTKELQTLVDEGRLDPALDLLTFPDAQSEMLWTSSTLSNDLTRSWVVDFENGFPSAQPAVNSFRVRCVR